MWDDPFSSFSVELLEIDTSTGEWVETRAVPAACFCVYMDRAGNAPEGVGVTSHSAFLVKNERSANMAKVINQVKSSPRSVQVKITCVNENAEGVTSMDTSPQYTSMKINSSSSI